MFVCVLVFLCVALLLRLTGFEVPVETLLPFDVELLEERLVRVASAVFVREGGLLELLLSERTASVVPVLLVLLFSTALAFAFLVLSFVELTLWLLFWLRRVVVAVLLSPRVAVDSLALDLVRVLFSLKSYLSALLVALVLLTLFERVLSG